MSTKLGDREFDGERLLTLSRAALKALTDGKCTAVEMQIVASVIFIGLSRTVNLSAKDAGKMLKLNWDQPLADAIRDAIDVSPQMN